jgi:hypothetical protein
MTDAALDSMAGADGSQSQSLRDGAALVGRINPA